MTVYLPKGAITWWYDFRYKGKRHLASTDQTRREDAVLVEAAAKLRLRQQAGGVAPFDPRDTPRFEDWAEIYLAYQREFTDRPDVIKRTLLVILEFWGAKPRTPKNQPAVARPPKVTPPYHNLNLGHPLEDATWIRRFDDWVKARGVSASTRNTYLSALSGMFKLAMQPEHRSETCVTSNPFRDVRRGAGGTRVVSLDRKTIVRWVQEAGYHVGLAATIAALAPKLRLGTILSLRWDEHFDADLRYITVQRHKTSRRTGAPQITPISDALRAVLLDARARQQEYRPKNPRATVDLRYVVTWRGRPVASIKTAAKRATKAIGLTWGVKNGVTFHTIRHSIATLLAEMGVSERIRMELLGHKEIRTTQKYTHLGAHTQVEPHAQLAAELPVTDVMLSKPRPKGKLLRMTTRRTA